MHKEGGVRVYRREGGVVCASEVPFMGTSELLGKAGSQQLGCMPSMGP